MMWFESLTGFCETSPRQVRTNLMLDGDTLRSRINGKVMRYGRLDTPSLAELRERVRSQRNPRGRISVREVVADVQSLHADASNGSSLLQAASQFNLLEMATPDIRPEEGVGIYEHDHTQGPACAIAAGAGTIYRNYFALVNGQPGQSTHNQIDCLADIGRALGNSEHRLWTMKNGYALASSDGLKTIARRLNASSEQERDALRMRLRIGLQWQTQVTLKECAHTVSQAYCSAMPIAYCEHAPSLWEPFARLVLEASYEATICAAIVNYREHGNNQVFLTLIGGGAFGNPIEWILGGIERALHLHEDTDLDVAIVSYCSSNPLVQEFVVRWRTGLEERKCHDRDPR